MSTINTHISAAEIEQQKTGYLFSKFGAAFQEAAHVSDARARHDRFEECVVEVRKDDLMNFVQKLHLSL